MTTLIVICIALIVYFFPSLLASHNKKKNVTAIGVLNFFLGWTVVGWIVALVWATTKD